MATDQTQDLAMELQLALDKLETALRDAAEAAAALSALAPRVAGIDRMIGEIEKAISGRAPASAAQAPAAPVEPSLGDPPPPVSISTPAPAAAWSRPTLVVPGHVPAAPWASGPSPEGAPEHEVISEPLQPELPPLQPGAAQNEPITSFRVAFESDAEPLDLRAVDEALAAQPAVRDVALLDYDGHRATLKVWISASARPEELQQALHDQAGGQLPAHGRISIIALDDVA